MSDDKKPFTFDYMEARADTGEPRVSDHGYHTDFGRWAADQARALRAAAHSASSLPIDWENVAEEIDALGKSQAREVAKRISTILVHLIKLQASPATDPRNAWRTTVRDQRLDLNRLLKDEAALKARVADIIQDELEDAKQQALDDMSDYDETPIVDIAEITFTEDQVLKRWFPTAS
jgi:hypothetical protein